MVVDEKRVSVRRVESEETDPVIGAFLGFLEQDLLRNPQNVVLFPAGMRQSIGTKRSMGRLRSDQ